MLVSWSLRYWTKAECCGEPVNLVGPIVLLTNFTSDHISSALGKSPSWNGSAALAGSARRGASADGEAPDPATNLRREIAIASSTAILLSTTAPNDPCRGRHPTRLSFEANLRVDRPPAGQFSLLIEPAHH